MARDAQKAQKQKAKKDQKRKKRLETAKKQERQFLQSNSPASIDAKVDKALDQLEKGNVDQAGDMLNKLRAKHDDKAYVHFALGLVACQDKDHLDAIECFEAAIELDAEFIEAYVNLARIYTEELDVKRAVENLRKVVDLKGKDVMLAEEAQTYLEQINEHCLKEDSLTMEKVIEAQTLFETALDLVEEKELEAAIISFKASIEIKANSAYVHSNLAFSYAALGRKSEAMDALAKAFELDAEEDFALSLKEPIEALEDGECLSFERT